MEFDVFLSHNSKDKANVEQIGLKLKEKYGLACWLDKWNLVPGEPWQEALENALDQCQTVAVFVGPNTISPWENEEMRSALEVRVHEKTRRVIPVLLPGAPDNRDLKLPRFLTRLTWVDMRSGINDENSLYLLYCGIKGIAPEDGIEKENKSGTLPTGSHIPFLRNTLFTGRENEVEKIANSLLGKKPLATLISQAIIGMGGIGKTQLAVEIAYHYGYLFKGVHWLDLRDPALLDSQIALCGEKMTFRYWPKEQPEQVSLTLRSWQTDGPRLIILDNFEDIQVAPQILSRLQNQNARLLITSRHSDWPATLGLQPLSLDVFTDEESIVFLKKYTKDRFTNDELKKLAIRLGELPLALELAGRYLDLHPRLSIDDYLNKTTEAIEHPSMQGFREDLPNPTGHELDLLKTFALSWLQVKHEITKNIFIISGYCAPNTTIPYEIFENTLSIDKTICDEELMHLIGLGLVKENTSLHPLLAEYARYLDQSKKQLSSLIQSFVEIIRKQNIEVDQSGNYSLFTPLISHIQLIAARAELENIQGAGYLWNDLGYHITDLGDLQGAKAAYERALRIDEAALGSDHPDVGRDLSNLGGVLLELGNFQGSKAAFERALRIDEAALGPDHPDVATDLGNLGEVLLKLGDFQGSKALFERALRIDETAFGPNHPKVASDISKLGVVLQNLADPQGSKVALERALIIDEAAFGPDHPRVATDVNDLGGVLLELGDLQGAKAAYERALRIDEATFGSDHPKVATDVNNLALVLHDLGDLQGAKAAFERALPVFEKAFKDTFHTAELLCNLGAINIKMGKSSIGLSYLRRASVISIRTLPHNHPLIRQIQEQIQIAQMLVKNPSLKGFRRKH